MPARCRQNFSFAARTSTMLLSTSLRTSASNAASTIGAHPISMILPGGRQLGSPEPSYAFTRSADATTSLARSCAMIEVRCLRS